MLDHMTIQHVQEASKKLHELHQKVSKAQVVGESGGGAVKIITNGKHYVSQVNISDETFEKEKKGVIQDLIAAAINDATDKIQKLFNSKINDLAGINLPNNELN